MAYLGPCYWKKLRLVTNAVDERYQGALAPVGLTINQYCILSNINKLDHPTTSTLAKAIELDRTTLVRTLKPLESRSLVQDAAEPGARDRKLRLTEQGKATLEEGRALWQQAQRETEEFFGKDAIEQLEHMVEAVHASERP